MTEDPLKPDTPPRLWPLVVMVLVAAACAVFLAALPASGPDAPFISSAMPQAARATALQCAGFEIGPVNFDTGAAR